MPLGGLDLLLARDLAVLLRAGALAAPVFKVDERVIGPTASLRDVFRYDNIYYATQSSTGPLFESLDGRDWQPSGIVTVPAS